MMGWECPRCGRVYSPFTAACAICPVPSYLGNGTYAIPMSPTYGCTCGTSVRCPLHASTIFPTVQSQGYPG